MEKSETDVYWYEKNTSFLLISGLIVSIMYLGGHLVYCYFDGWDERGSFGDMFGAFNTLFSGLAFAAVTLALFCQQKELKEQRLENAKQVEIAKITALINVKSTMLYNNRSEYFKIIQVKSKTQKAEEHKEIFEALKRLEIEINLNVKKLEEI